MRTIEEIDREINELEKELEQVQGRPTEVYSRIVGYYRSLRNWNLGKREEYTHRRVFDSSSFAESTAVGEAPAENSPVSQVPEQGSETENVEGEKPVEYLYFYRETCPNCPPVRALLAGIGIPGTDVNIDTKEGIDAALEFGIYAAPTVVFLGDQKEEVFRASSVDQLNALKIPQIA
jgi:ribonucleoside-triphosphate reductase